MREYGKPIYIKGGEDFDGYEYITIICDDCGDEHKAEYSADYDLDLCPKCLGLRIEQEEGVITE